MSNKKPFLTGFGIGMMLTSIICYIFFSFYTNDIIRKNTLSDAEIIEKAKNLGMTYQFTPNNSPVSENIAQEKQTSSVKIEIKKGSNLHTISTMLYDEKLINNVKDFEKYVMKQKKLKILQSGIFEITPDATYEQIVNILTKK